MFSSVLRKSLALGAAAAVVGYGAAAIFQLVPPWMPAARSTWTGRTAFTVQMAPGDCPHFVAGATYAVALHENSHGGDVVATMKREGWILAHENEHMVYVQCPCYAPPERTPNGSIKLGRAE